MTPHRLETELRNGKHIMNTFSFSILSLGDTNEFQSFKHHVRADDLPYLYFHPEHVSQI